MRGINNYFRALSEEEIREKAHRAMVGGLWEEIGQLQLDFMRGAGLEPGHALLDIGCGSLRGGIRFIDYLDTGNYAGLDINASLIEGGKQEIADAGLIDKAPQLIVDDAFRFAKTDRQFDFMIAVSVFTHLPMNMIIRCLRNARDQLTGDGRFYATFFEAPHSAHLAPVTHEAGGIVTQYDADPFHHSIDELAFMASVAGLEVDVIGDWGHPRSQQMAAFSRIS